LAWWCAADTHPGNVRGNNEDAVYAGAEKCLWAVADGMGGHEAGEFASACITKTLQDLQLGEDLSDCVDQIEDALLAVNDQLRAYARTHFSGNTVGSTVVAAVVRGEVGVVLWAGDSRAYRLRGQCLEQITRDHNPIADLLDSGNVSEAEAVAADTHVITRAVGGQLDLHLDVAIFDVEPNDTLLLCSDGLYRELEAPVVINALQADVDEAVSDLMRTTLRGPARDNVSLVVTRAQAGR
jgi:protein phosphatase